MGKVDLVISREEKKVLTTFNWLVVLGVVTVTITLTIKDKLDGEALNPNTLLSHIWPGALQ